MRDPETSQLANAAFTVSGCKSHPQFVALFGEGAIGLRTFRGWLKGEQPAAPLAKLVLREFIAGWRPTLPALPEGVFELGGKMMFTCRTCDQAVELHCDLSEFDPEMAYCGGSPRCLP